jgi:hypothetical protein
MTGDSMKTVLVVLATLLLLVTTQSQGHHSTSNFDFEKSVAIEGKVTYMSFTNPHSFIDIDVDDKAGKKTSWKVFATSRVVLQRYGWTSNSVKPGDAISVTGHPDKTKPHEMYLTKIVFANGTTWLRSSIDN